MCSVGAPFQTQYIYIILNFDAAGDNEIMESWNKFGEMRPSLLGIGNMPGLSNPTQFHDDNYEGCNKL
jgi:hypothetical protein